MRKFLKKPKWEPKRRKQIKELGKYQVKVSEACRRRIKNLRKNTTFAVKPKIIKHQISSS